MPQSKRWCRATSPPTSTTPRSETLYAILVGGVGPLGSVFSRDDFSDREVKDTDGDGLPEFVDAWGQPLQFFRWPLLYHTDTQRGQVIDYGTNAAPPVASAIELFNPPYRSVFEDREQDPLDPNQQLMAPAWWSSTQNRTRIGFTAGTAASVGGSGGVLAFEYFFHRLTEPFQNTGGHTQFYWDRASPVYPQGTSTAGPSSPNPDTLLRARPATGNLPTVPEQLFPNPPTPTAACLICTRTTPYRSLIRPCSAAARPSPPGQRSGGLDDLPAPRERP